jgi:acyl-coenzyme A synthetase/AMP-(fatty) acid ligase/thioesterase domain-containing protein/acyl carrier protein
MNNTFLESWLNVVKRNGQARALSNVSSSLTFIELNEKAISLAYLLIQKKIRGKCIIIRLDDRMESVIAILGILLSGNHYFYLSRDAYRNSDQFIPFLDVGAILINSETDHNHDAYESLCWSSLESCSIEQEALPKVADDEPFVVFTTSGSTGAPKLVRHNHRFILDDTGVQMDQLKITPNDKRDYTGSLMFSASLGAIFPVLLSGAQLIIHSLADKGVFALPEFWKKHEITITSVPVSMLRTIVKSGLTLNEHENLRVIAVTGEMASQEDMEKFIQIVSPKTFLANGYATTETRGISLALFDPLRHDPQHLSSLGHPIPTKRVYIFDEDHQPVGPGGLGQIAVEGAGLPKSYLNQPSGTSSSFIESSSGNTLFLTGDLGLLTPDGRLELKSRIDSIVKVNGIKVSLLEIELCIARFPGVKEVAVVQNPNRRFTAYLSYSSSLDLSELKKFVSDNVAPVQMPSRWQILNELPRTITGKIDRKKLQSTTTATVRPATTERGKHDPLLASICAIWEEALEWDEEIHADQDFFYDLGGDSLLCAACLHELELQLHLTLPLAAGYTYTTPASLANYILDLQKKMVVKIPLTTYDAAKDDLYLIPPYPGDRRTYQRMESGLAKSFNLFFLFYNPLDKANEPVPFEVLLEELAAQIDPTRETHLLGFSFGGILSYFLALKLENKGQSIARIVLIDTPLYNRYSATEKMLNFGKRCLNKVRRLASTPSKHWVKDFIHLKTTLKNYRANFTPEKFKEDPSHPSKVIWTYASAFPSYRRTQADILLFRAKEDGMGYEFKPDYSWQRLTEKGFCRIELTGWHVELLSIPENVDVIVKAVSSPVDQAVVVSD